LEGGEDSSERPLPGPLVSENQGGRMRVFSGRCDDFRFSANGGYKFDRPRQQ
jgi:hypothetical protein